MARVILILILIFTFYRFLERPDKPKIYKNMHIKNLKHLDFDYFIKNFGDYRILIEKFKNKFETTTIKDYCQNILQCNQSGYLKSEDEYDLLKILGIKDQILKEFNTFFDKNVKNIIYRDLGFFMGGKGTVTNWHTDIEDLNYLYVTKGKKRIMLISPIYNDCMYEEKHYSGGARWSNINFKNVDYDKYPKYKNVVVHTYTLNEGDCIYVPKNWWHCVENLEDSIGIVYKIFTINYIYTRFMEKLRMIYNVYILGNRRPDITII